MKISAVSKRKACGIVYLVSIFCMDEPDFRIFSALYRQAFLKCFKEELKQPVSETEAKLFYQQILEQTGLIIGWRSLKNYSFFVLRQRGEKPENPSVASMDTLARYVLQAPYTDEVSRKKDEAHHPYWFLFREKNIPPATGRAKKPGMIVTILCTGLLLTALAVWLYKKERVISFTDHFQDLRLPELTARGWDLRSPDSPHWSLRNTNAGRLTMYTLAGDNWPDSSHLPAIQNLLIRALPSACFTAEIQLENFAPDADWQQAGLLLLEDSSLNSASLRISIAYNDFFGGFRHAGEVLVQSIYAAGNGQKPEELIHLPIVTMDSLAVNPALRGNLQNTALRIEKNGNQYHLLYAGGVFSNGAFRELAVKELNFSPKYIALFAFKGWQEKTPAIPVIFRRFSLDTRPCAR